MRTFESNWEQAVLECFDILEIASTLQGNDRTASMKAEAKFSLINDTGAELQFLFLVFQQS